MYSTFHNALDSWPTGRRRTAAVDTRSGSSSNLYDKVTFGEDDHPPPASSVFKVIGANYPVGKVFVPPFFIPPGSTGSISNGETTTLQHALERNDAQPKQGSQARGEHDNIDPAIRNLRGPILKARPLPSDVRQSNSRTRQDLEHPSRSPSPALNSTDLERQRQANWSDFARQAFHAMSNAPGYVNRYRLHPAKYQRLLTYLRSPDVDPLNEDGSKDHQTKYQAANWILRDGKLYRKAERKGDVGTGLRRHLDVDEVWDVLTAEHLRTDHLGRDRLRKVLERRYIGYTLQEIMFVLRECKSCNGRLKISPAACEDEQLSFEQANAASEDQTGDQTSSADQRSLAKVPEGRREKRQSSNFMWF